MATINLLPWREEMRQEKKKEFLTQLGGVCAIAVFGAFLWVQSVESAISNQNTRNAMLESEIKTLEKQVEEIKELKKKRKELIDRMRVIQDLEGKRSIIVHYFDEMAKSVPDGVYVTSISRRGDTFSIEGISESNNRISEFMRLLSDSEWFDSPFYKGQKTAPDHGPQAAEFSLDVNAVLPESMEEDKNG